LNAKEKKAFVARMKAAREAKAKTRKSKPKKSKRKPKRILSERKQKGTPAKISKKRLSQFYKGRAS